MPPSNKKHEASKRKTAETHAIAVIVAGERLRLHRLHRCDTYAFNFNNGRKLIGYRRRGGVPMTGRTVAPEARTQVLHTHIRDERMHAIFSLSLFLFSIISTYLALYYMSASPLSLSMYSLS